jgi:hypothetical protein
MKPLLATALLLSMTAIGFAQPAEPIPAPPAEQPGNCCQPAPAPQAAPQVAYAQPQTQPSIVSDPSQTIPDADDSGWKRPVGRRFLHGFRLGWTYVMHYQRPTRDNGMSLAEEFELKSPNMTLLGYEGFYRIIGHSWLNVLMVGNVTVAGLEQSKFIPAASGLIGFEFNRNFQVGVGVNVTPDGQSPTHMIAAAGWTPSVGSIQTPVHFFFVPDTESNHRMGATIGMTW